MKREPEPEERPALVIDLRPKRAPTGQVIAVARPMKPGRAAIKWPPKPPDTDDPPSAA